MTLQIFHCSPEQDRGTRGKPRSDSKFILDKHSKFDPNLTMDHHRADHSESFSPSTTLLWSQLELWMEEDYLWRACKFMNWFPIAIRIPNVHSIPATGQQPNNPGYCYLVFRSSSQAAAALAQVSDGRETAPVMMPYSSTPYILCWAPMPPYTMNPTNPKPVYSIFIADLSPSANENDILQVFRNPQLGQSPYREPKIIQPFNGCTSVKIILDPNGQSSTSAFVRYVHSYSPEIFRLIFQIDLIPKKKETAPWLRQMGCVSETARVSLTAYMRCIQPAYWPSSRLSC